MHQIRNDPLVLEACTIGLFLQYLMNQHASPTHLIICSSRAAFLHQVLAELNQSPSHLDPEQDRDEHGHAAIPELSPAGATSASDIIPLLRPTLHFLATSRTVTVAYCPDLTHLLAHLSTLTYRESTSTQPAASSGQGPSTSRPILAILNPIQLHRPTSSFSAQGFNRTFAAAVDTAHHLGQQLVLAEIESLRPHSDSAEGHKWHGENWQRSDAGGQHGVPAAESPWDEKLSMLNVTTKTFGVGERGWVGRTVSVRQVASRWCRFVDLASSA